MSSPAPAKRRRLNDATQTLSKPFVSPLRSAKTPRQPLRENSSLASQPYTPSTLAHTIKAACPHPSASNPVAVISTPARKHPVIANSSKKRIDPAELAAQKALTALELHIRRLRNDLDTLRQAAQITSTNTDAELESITTKWRLASQQAAEELFGTVKDRVCRMGGVAAWRESEKKKHDRAHGIGEFAWQQEEEVDDDADCEFDSQGEELPEEEQEFRKREKRRVRQEAMDAMDAPDVQSVDVEVGDGKPKVWQEEGKDDDSFTMDMMLRSLNIDLKVVGYDKSGQRWLL